MSVLDNQHSPERDPIVYRRPLSGSTWKVISLSASLDFEIPSSEQ